MKMIDLLNKIANGETSEDTIVEFDNGYKDYCSVKIYFDRYVMDRENLNNEVEIIEEEKKIPKKLGTYTITDETISGMRKSLNTMINIDIIGTINELIDYLKSKGDE